MSLLSDKELWALVPNADNLNDARAIEAAILAKLASAELPEPLMKTFRLGPMFTTEQMKSRYAQGFAAGAAAQLAHEPLFYVRNDEINRWNGLSGMGFSGPLYTRREA